MANNLRKENDGVSFEFAHPDSAPTPVGSTARGRQALDVALMTPERNRDVALDRRSRDRSRSRRHANDRRITSAGTTAEVRFHVENRDSAPVPAGDSARAGSSSALALIDQTINRRGVRESRARERNQRRPIENDSDTSLDSENPRRRRRRRMEAVSDSTSEDEPIPRAEENSTAAKRATFLYRCVCGGKHRVAQCQAFRSWSPERRLRKTIAAQLCTNCLAHDHRTSACRSKYSCRQCGQKHHTLLHNNSSGSGRRERNVGASRGGGLQSATSRAHAMPLSANGPLVLLPTVRCYILYQARRLSIRALVNSCAQSTEISISMLRSAGIHRRVGDRVDVTLCSRHDTHVRVTVAATVVSNIEMRTPQAAISQEQQDRVGCFKLADDTFGAPGPVQMVLGAEVYPKIISHGVVVLPGIPVAQQTKFGMVLSGSFA